jgi:PleD family two-component response regulator
LKIIPGMPPEVLPKFADKMLTTFREHAELKVPGRDAVRFTVSIGFAVMKPVHGVPINRELLLEAADKAMYAAKMNGRDQFHILQLSIN